MCHIGTDNHAFVLAQNRRVLQLVVETVQLSIDFQQNVGNCARVSAFSIHRECFDALRQDATTQFGRLFDARIRIAAIWDDTKKDVAILFLDVFQCTIQLSVIAATVENVNKIVSAERHAIRTTNSQNL